MSLDESTLLHSGDILTAGKHCSYLVLRRSDPFDDVVIHSSLRDHPDVGFSTLEEWQAVDPNWKLL